MDFSDSSKGSTQSQFLIQSALAYVREERLLLRLRVRAAGASLLGATRRTYQRDSNDAFLLSSKFSLVQTIRVSVAQNEGPREA